MICWVCGHSKIKHVKNALPEKRPLRNFCNDCANEVTRKPMEETYNVDPCWHNFETNLDYIERLAKERNLI